MYEKLCSNKKACMEAHMERPRILVQDYSTDKQTEIGGHGIMVMKLKAILFWLTTIIVLLALCCIDSLLDTREGCWILVGVISLVIFCYTILDKKDIDKIIGKDKELEEKENG